MQLPLVSESAPFARFSYLLHVPSCCGLGVSGHRDVQGKAEAWFPGGGSAAPCSAPGLPDREQGPEQGSAKEQERVISSLWLNFIKHKCSILILQS